MMPSLVDMVDQRNGGPAPHDRHIWQYQPVRDVLVLLTVFGVIYLGYLLSPVTVPMLIGLGLAYLMEPVVAGCGRRWKWATRSRVVIGTLLMLSAAMMAFLVVTIPLVVRQTADLSQRSGQYIKTVLSASDAEVLPRWLGDELSRIRARFAGAPFKPSDQVIDGADSEDAVAQVGLSGVSGDGSEAESNQGDDAKSAENPPAPTDSTAQSASLDQSASSQVADDEYLRQLIRDELAVLQQERSAAGADDNPSQLLPSVGRVIGGAVKVFTAITTGVIGLAIGIFLVGFFYIVFGLNYPKFIDFMRQFVPEPMRDRADELARQMDRAVAGFVRGRLVIAGILSLVFAGGWLICGVPYSLLLGIVVGMLTLVPYLCGLGVAFAYALLVVELIGGTGGGWYVDAQGAVNWWLVAILPAIPFVVAQLLDDYVLTPIIQGKATNLSMAAVVVSVLAGGILAGVYGMLLAIPAAACLRIALIELVWPRIQAWAEGRRSDPLPIDAN